MIKNNISRNNQDNISEHHSEKSNGGQPQSLSGLQDLGFIGNKNNKIGKKEGFGIQKWKDGSIYKGNFINGEADGWGIFYYSDGDIFKGQFAKDIICGYGERYHMWIR